MPGPARCVFNDLTISPFNAATKSVRGRQEEHLFQRGEAIPHAVQGRHAKRAHTVADSDFAHLTRVGAGNDELADFVADGHRFDDGHPAGVTGILAPLTAAAAIQDDAVENAWVNVQILE